jgi:cleavage stimulation factor subunit 2
MNDYELNGRRLRVNFSNSSHLEALAGKLGMDLSAHANKTHTATNIQQPTEVTGANAVADALKGFSKAEMYDVVAKLKEIADRDPDEARRVISGHPQLPEALLFIMSKLDMVKTPLAVEAQPLIVPVAQTIARVDPRAVRADPRQAVAAPVAVADPRAAPRADPRQQRVDPRAVAVDPRAAAADPRAARNVPPPPPRAYAGAPPPAQLPAGVAHLDPSLVQQVMSLTPEQIQQLPPDKRQSIMALRQQITGGSGL